MSSTSFCQVNTKHESLTAILEEVLEKVNTHDPPQAAASEETADGKLHRRAATILLICMTREDFVAQLAGEIHQSQSPPQPQTQPHSQDNTIITTEPTADTPDHTKWQTPPLPSPHPLLTPLLSTIHSARSTTLVFTPTIPMFRAYIATTSFGAQAATRRNTAHITDAADDDDTDLIPPQGGRRSRPSVDVVVVNMVSMHRGTSQFTLQGLGRTCAGIAEAVGRANEIAGRFCRAGEDEGRPEARRVPWPGYRAVLVECRDPTSTLPSRDGGTREEEREGGGNDEEGGGEGEVHNGAADVVDGTSSEARYEGRGIWDTPVSLLSGSVRMGTDAWGGRRVSVRKVVERWFDFVHE